MSDDELEQDYSVVGELGRGGMAVVYLAEQITLAREVAIKRAVDPHDAETHLLLLREALITGQLEHPNIVPVHALIGDAVGPAVVMKRLSGHTWDALIHGQSVPLERHLEILAQVINAVSFAHSRGVLHRDIKPANVMIGDFGEVYLLDWGVAQRESDPPSDAIVGTPFYMAPEMAEGRADARTDVFLLGATLHEVLVRQPRHRGDSALEVLYAAMNIEPYAYPESVPEELAAICNRACARAPQQRFASAAALREALATFREHRAANTLSERAEEELAGLRRAIDEEAAGNADVQQRFSRTRFGFEAALQVWSESPVAHQGLQSCLCAMIDYELGCRRPEAALALLNALRTSDGERTARARALEAEIAQRQQRALAMERDRDPRVGAPDRARAYRAMAIVTLAVTSTALVQRVVFPGYRPTSLRLTIMGGVVLAVMGGIIGWWRRNGDWNFINRRIAEIALSTLAVSAASRLSGFLLHAPADHMLTTDAFILGLGGAVMSAYHPAGPWLAAVSILVAVFGSVWPGSIYDLFIGLSVCLPLVFLLTRRVDSAQTERGEAERADALTRR